ncbi:uncharacterized protein BO66DRAFT_460604, partial [Aspergillus aculeatinus CBS 121060]
MDWEVEALQKALNLFKEKFYEMKSKAMEEDLDGWQVGFGKPPTTPYLHNWANNPTDTIKTKSYVIPASKVLYQHVESAKKFLNALEKEVRGDEAALQKEADLEKAARKKESAQKKRNCKKEESKDCPDSGSKEFVRPAFDEDDEFTTSMSFKNPGKDQSNLYNWVADRHLIWEMSSVLNSLTSPEILRAEVLLRLGQT